MALIIVLTNQSALAEVSDYTYEVLVGDGTPAGSLTLAHGQVLGHRRSDGWHALVARLLQETKSGATDTGRES